MKIKDRKSTNKPYKRAKSRVKGKNAGRNMVVRRPPTSATYVAPILFNIRDPIPSKTAYIIMSILSNGDSRKALDTNMMVPKKVAIAIFFVGGLNSPIPITIKPFYPF